MRNISFSFVLMGLIVLSGSSQAAFGDCVGNNCYKDISIRRTFGGARTSRPAADKDKAGQSGGVISKPAAEEPSEPYRDGNIFPSSSCDVESSTILGDGSPCNKPNCAKCPAAKPAPAPEECKTCGKTIRSALGKKPCRPCPPKIAKKLAPKIVEMPAAPASFSCGDFAPVELQWVDFRIKKSKLYEGFSNKLGQYRFRIFGCRRETKNIFLNQGRTIEKDMHFFDIFDEIAGGCYKTVKTPQDICINRDKPLPEYVLTAEITDYFMNVCDGHNWLKGKKEDLRTGSSEMTVTWRLMDLTKTKTLWKGSSVGYAEIAEGEYNGDLHLVEQAFADAVENLRLQPGFEQQLATRISPDELRRQRSELIAFQQKTDPAKCEYQEEIEEALFTQSTITYEDGEDVPVMTTSEGGSTVSVTLTDGEEVTEEAPQVVTYFDTDVEECETVLDNVAKEVLETSGINSAEVFEQGGISSVEFNEFLESSGITSKEFVETAGIDSREFSEQGGVSLDEFKMFLERGGINTFVTSEESTAKPVASGAEETFGSASSGSKPKIFDDPEIIRLIQECSVTTIPGEVFERSGSFSAVSEVMESSGINTYVSSEEVGTRVVSSGATEKGGLISSGTGENSGADISSSLFAENIDEITVETSCYRTEDGKILHEAAAADVISAGGAITKVTCLVEDIEHAGDYWLDVIPNEESSALSGTSQICIKDRKPYDTLNEEAVAEIRSSLVTVQNARNLRGAGLLVSENIVLTSADLIVKDKNVYDITLGDGTRLEAKAFRINPNKNIALLALDKEVSYSPLALSYELPDIGDAKFTSLGLYDVKPGKDDFTSSQGSIEGYRYSETLGTEIVVETFIQTATIGGVLFDDKGTVFGISHMGRRLEDGADIFIPVDVAIRSVGLDVCGREVILKKPSRKPAKPSIAKLIEKSKAPKAMKKKERK